MKTNRAGLADALGVSLPSVDRYVRDGMPVERNGRKGVESSFDVAACIRWLRQRDAARTLPPPINGRPRESRSSRQDRREVLRSLWVPKECLIPWKHPSIEPLDVWERHVGIDGTGESFDLMWLGMPYFPPTDGSPLARISLPHAYTFRVLLGLLVSYCGGNGGSRFRGREMRRLCGLPLADDDEDDAPRVSED
jgi:hypothetical protein